MTTKQQTRYDRTMHSRISSRSQNMKRKRAAFSGFTRLRSPWPPLPPILLLLLPLLETGRSTMVFPGNNCQLYEQPGVGRIELCLHGDESCHYLTYTADDGGGDGDDNRDYMYTVVHEDHVVDGVHTGYYAYTTLGFNGVLISTGHRVGADDPAAHSITPGILPSCLNDNKEDGQNDQLVHRDPSLLPARHDRHERGGLRGLQSSNLRTAAKQQMTKKQRRRRKQNKKRRKAETYQTGRRRYLVVPVRFADHARIGRQLPTTRQLNELYNGSLGQIFLANSERRFNLQSVITPDIDLPEDEVYYSDPGNRVSREAMRELIHYILDWLDNDPDFQFHDPSRDGPNPVTYIGMNIVMSGYGGEFGGVDCDTQATSMERPWTHQWATQTWTSQNEDISFKKYILTSAFWGTCSGEIMKVGPVFHETSHLLGLSDLYHLSSTGYQGVGAYDVMGDAYGFDRKGEGGLLAAYSRVKLGWCREAVLNRNGVYTLQPSSSESSRCRVYRINIGFLSKKEYLLIEARAPIEYDKQLPEQGLAIWHIDKSIKYMAPDPPPTSPRWPLEHGRVVLLQADGQHHLQTGVYQTGQDNDSLGDLYHSGDSLVPGYDHSNSNSWFEGIVANTGIRIFNIRRLDDGGMQFEFTSDLL